MSKKATVVPNFRFSYSFLKQLADSTLLLIDRDINEFTDRGFNTSKRSEMVTTITNFSNFVTDEQMNAIKTDITEIKNAQRDSLEKQMRTTLLAAKNVFGETSSQYREFGSSDVGHLVDAELVRNAKMMITTATKYLSDLAPEGISAAKVTALDNLKTSFDSSIDLQKQSVHNRDNSTEERSILANNLYALIVKYCETGRDIWAGTSEAKYNDYVIYNTITGEPELSGESATLNHH